ncbi:unnamed protein product [Pelagomonas calceolata]|uniref:Thiol oxidase n=1 Tax=Pelagomonas calceolata TaxID=35677 RepID=A0A8J2WWV5_9STRA|nr:unnamed protein product [Pelagomonas calceolata]|mmetsp:Transcript_8747/g.27351  ORF Transcript_8747/g.27351 Transcript_8747/m.27351 type:complete len:305 (+) Transcript_8747:154-1068(+)
MHAKAALLAAAAVAFAPPPSQPAPPRPHAASIALEEEPAKPVRGVRRAALWMNVRSALCYANNIFPKNAYGRGVSFRAKREGFWVSPANPWAAKPIIRACRTIKSQQPYLLNDLRKNVCFLHNPDKKLSPQFVMHCDWCSLLNGICHTIKTNAGTGDEAARVIGVASGDFERAEAYMRFAMASRHNEDENAFLRDADAYCDEAFGSLDESLRVFSRFALRLERVELVWCPFKRCAEDYYRNADARYRRHPSPEAEEALYKRLGAMLGDTVECRDCASEFNAEFPMEGSNARSIYQGLLDALCND